MGSLKTFAFAGAMLVGATVAASAADFGARHAPPPPPPVPVATPIVETSGWYLRGDVGVAHQSFKPELEDRRFPAIPVVGTYDKDFSKVPFAGVGFGYQFNSWLRADVTAEHRFQQNFRFEDRSCFGTGVGGVGFAIPGSACTAAQFAGPAANYNRNFYDGRLTTNLFLANAYIDLGNWSGFTPFVGVGGGFASHTFGKVTDVGATDRYTAGVYTGTSSSNLVTFKDATQTKFAWALMAGVAYDLSPNAKIEVGYRYLNMGKAKQYIFDCSGGPGVAGTCGDFLHYKNIQAHELKIGLRYMFGGPSYAAAPAVYQPGHVVKRY